MQPALPTELRHTLSFQHRKAPLNNRRDQLSHRAQLAVRKGSNEKQGVVSSSEAFSMAMLHWSGVRSGGEGGGYARGWQPLAQYEDSG